MKLTDSHQRSIVKSISYRAIATLVTFLIAYLWTKNLTLATSLSIAINLIKTFTFYLHERLWNYFSFGQKRISQKGFTLWFTGLPASGKTTIANAVAQELERKYALPVERLDGDILRQTICKDLGFSAEDRQKNIERVTYIAKLLTKNRVAVLTSFISPNREVRNWAREAIGNFVEVYTKCPIEECIRRDPKGQYKKALTGQIAQFTGISDPYEEPENPEIIVETDKENVKQCVKRIIKSLKKLGYLD
jgi:adenylyl-sulfate kinase